MINVVALIADPRLRAQVEEYLTELALPDLKTAFFEDVKEFEALYFKSSAQAPTPSTATEPHSSTTGNAEGDVELRLFSEVHALIFGLDHAHEAGPAAWLEQLRAHLRTHNHLPATGLRLIWLRHEDENLRLEPLHPYLDDLIYQPLDRLVFLQKMQIFLNFPKRVAPTFLFNQPYTARIEISKVSKLDRLSDVALAIRNPVPLCRNLPGHFVLHLPGEKNAIEIKGKVLRSEPHPEHPTQFLVYFGFFGPDRAAVASIRRVLQKDTHYKSLLHDDHERFAFDPSAVMLSDEERREFGVVIIDRDEHEATQLSQVMRHEMSRLRVLIEPSYSLFLHRYLDHEASSLDKNMPRPTEPIELYAESVALILNASSLAVLRLEPPPGPDDQILGFKASDLLENPGVAKALLSERGTAVLLAEAPTLATAGRPLEKLLVLKDARAERAAIDARILPAAEGLRLELKTASLGLIADRALADRRHEHLDALIVQTEVVPPDPRAWIEGLRLKAAELKLTRPGHELLFWLLARNEEIPESWLDIPGLAGVVRRPVDLRQLLFSFSEQLPNLNTIYQFYNLGWTQPGLNVHVAKPIDLEALSEYGATLRSPQRLAPGTVIYLRRSIYAQAPGEALAARVYACEEHPNVENEFEVYVTYWGITDAFLKFARTWIRENYAAQKSKG